MKIDRRSFLSLVAGGAAGTALSPLPWKLIDDSSIWTQNWPWTPVPTDGESNYVDSVCTLCPGGCGISVRKIDNRVVKIEGKKDHPVNNGGICILGLAGLQLLYSPSRIKSPLKRTGKRGEGKWKEISWNQAVSEITEKLSQLREKNIPETLACISGSAQGVESNLFKRFLEAFGSQNFMSVPSIQNSYDMTIELMHGAKGSVGFDFENTDFLLSFGSGILDGWGSPAHMFKANSGWKTNKSKMVQVESRLSKTAAKADKWIPINPGTEGILALGLGHVIIKKSLHNKDFVNNFSSDFNQFKKDVIDRYTPDKVADITGVDKSVIINLAKEFAGASKPLAICGRGQGDIPGSLKEFGAVHALNALMGSINSKGGMFIMPEQNYIQWDEVKADAISSAGMKKDRVDEAGSVKFPHSKSLLNRLSGIINSSKESPVQALFVTGANPLYTMSDTGQARKSFDKIPFIASFSSFMDETAHQADLILPNHIFLERYEDVPTPPGFAVPSIFLAKPVIEPVFNTKHSGDAIIKIAKTLGGSIGESFPWTCYENCLKKTLGDKWGTLLNQGVWMDKNFKPSTWANAFGESSTQFYFVPKSADPFSGPDLINAEGDQKSYPQILISYDSMRLANGFIADPPFVIKTVSDTVLKGKDIFVELNPDTARELGLHEGDYANLSTLKAKVKVRVHIFNGIKPGVIAMPTGLGHTAYDKYLAEKGINYNKLIGSVEDPVSGLDAAWGIRAKLAKA